MSGLYALYQAIERTFFNSLTKKIVGNVIFLLLPLLVMLIYSYLTLTEVDDALKATGLANAHIAEVQQGLDALWHAILVAAVVMVLVGGFTIGFMRHLFLAPIKQMIEVLSAIKDEGGDISATLPAYTFDEISEMARSYNSFSDQLKRMIAETRRRSVQVGVEAARLQRVLQKAHGTASEQEQQAQQVFVASQEANTAITDISDSTQAISGQNGSNLIEVRTSHSELSKVREQVEAIREQASLFQDTVNHLSQNSANITKILQMVQEFSEQTNLLALNASIEAARAGEAGRGFAVVADEVRSLSHKVSSATQEIDSNITEMSALVHTTRQSADNILQYAENTESFIGSTHQQFARLVSDFEAVNDRLSGISAALEELSLTNNESHGHVQGITRQAGEIKDEMDQSQVFFLDLGRATEEAQELLSHFVIGYGGFENMLHKGQDWAAQVMQQLEALAGQGCNLFDFNYRPTNPGQQPEKFDTSYVDRFEQWMQPLFDSFIAERSDFTYAIAVDRNGYAPAHHKKVSAPLSGNFDEDNAKSRHRRIFFGSRAEQRRATNTSPFLLQTFVRDTGEVLIDLSIPLYLNGQHWGALIMGFDPNHLLEQQD
ncbi:methyl-accepting chemotaxis protein [Marinobacterium arenosum]|uniref:methyl-accepting chemotaxis protein n=1 Tax=Marinobacterium arenosum TaxID=2862496 RepID=UPI001C95BE95|nr:methyl-accepting chemotaxis protein [Marinobacterium arenosum]MBY4675746.1 methyl-accepting chemotaxis protein [Marinobacterium arenosum]